MPRLAEKRNAPDIERLIALVNSVPPELDLPSAMDPGRNTAFVGAGTVMERLATEEPFSEFRRLTAGVEVSLSYWLLREARELLRQVASLPARPGRAMLPKGVSVRFVEIDARGRLHFLIDLLKIFDKVEVARIRKCECGRFFWARTLGKHAQTGCCPSHSARIKMRRLRKEKPEIYGRAKK